jgi:hypothetical protein
MFRFKNISSQGALDLPLLGRIIAAGEEFEVTPEQAEHLAKQPDVWKPLDPPPSEYDSRNVTELKQLLEERQLSTSGKKPDLIARLVESDEVTGTQGASA